MEKLQLEAIDFKKMEGPLGRHSLHKKYVCYIKADSIPKEIDQWFGTNPREQKMTTSVARDIRNSLLRNSDFHELNRGIVLSVKNAKWSNDTKKLELMFENPEIHGNIDGGHTLRAILDAQKGNNLLPDRYVFAEISEGLRSPIELAAARNTSVQVDLKSIEELNKSFDVLKKHLIFCLLKTESNTK